MKQRTFRVVIHVSEINPNSEYSLYRTETVVTGHVTPDGAYQLAEPNIHGLDVRVVPTDEQYEV